MNLKQWVSLTTLANLALAGSAALAAEPVSATAPRERAEVVAETLAARAARTLAPAGEHVEPRAAVVTGQTARARADVRAEVLAARASGELVAAGEAEDLPVTQDARRSVLARATVKAEVLAARAAGDLVPAGEGPSAEGAGRAKHNARGVDPTRTASLSK